MVQKHQDETLRRIDYQLKNCTPPPAIVQEYAERAPVQSPSDWFSRKFPALAERYGPPILEAVEPLLDQSTRITPVALNEDFFAALLGGDKRLGHDLVYYEPAETFYFFDSRFQRYEATLESKLVLLLSQYLIQCAAEMPGDVEIHKLFLDLRKEDNLWKIVQRAKALLAAGEAFFSEASEHKWPKGRESHGSLAKAFARDILKPVPDSTLTVSECYEIFCEFCQDKGCPPVSRRWFRSLIVSVIREEFNLRLRHDVLGSNNRQQNGWKGLIVDCGGNELPATPDQA